MLAGMKLSSGSAAFGPLRWTLLIVGLSSIAGLVYLLNQWKDRASDLANEKLPLVAQEHFSRKSLITESIVLAVIGITTLLAGGFGGILPWIAAIFGVAGLLYNFGPFALQNRPLSGLLAGLIGGWLLLRIGSLATGEAAPITKEIPYTLAFAAGCLLTTLPDIEGDRANNKRTFAVAYGEWRTVSVAALLVLASAQIAALNRDWLPIPAALIGLVSLVITHRQRSIVLAVKGNKFSILTLSLAVGWYFPVYLVIIALYFPLARWYHRQRFGVVYPSLSD